MTDRDTADAGSPSSHDGIAEEGIEVEATIEGPDYCAYTDYSQDTPSETSLPATGENASGIEQRVWGQLYEIDDPEMPVSIVDLGLIYGVRVVEESEATAGDDSNTDEEDIAGDAVGTRVAIDMTLTYTGCPARKMLTEEVEEEVRSIEGVSEVALELVWSPNWSLEMVTEQGRADLREFGLSVPEREEA
jgi:metal-sulfur cluster biosynthetic enzyme